MRMFVWGNETIMDEKLKPSLHHTCSRAQTAFILYAPRLFSCHPTISFTLLLPHSSVLLEIAFDSALTPLSLSQRRRVRRGSVPSRTSSSSGRWSEWLGAKAGSPQRTPPFDVTKAATVLACGRKVLQAKCDLSNKVQVEKLSPPLT